jgi:hypothetical protein
LSLRRQQHLPLRLFHKGGLGTPPVEGVYFFCQVFPMIDPATIPDWSSQTLTYGEITAIQKLMNWLNGITSSCLSNSLANTPNVSSSGETSGHNTARENQTGLTAEMLQQLGVEHE